MLVRRILMLTAVLVAVAVIASNIAPDDLRSGGDDDLAVAATSLPAGKSVERTISATPSATGERVIVRRGDTLRLEVAGDLLDSVLIERLDLIDPVAPERPARFNLLIDQQAGSYPIRLVQADRRIASLVIRP